MDLSFYTIYTGTARETKIYFLNKKVDFYH